MSSASVEQLKEKLLSCLDEERNVTNMAGALNAITNLQTVSITREVLEATRLGLLVNDIRRKNQELNPQLGKLCRGLIKDWQKLVSDASSQPSGGGKLGVSPAGVERITTPSGRTTTPRQMVAAKLIAESGLRCSPSPALTPKSQLTTPVTTVNGSAQRSSVSPAAAVVASPSSSQRGGPVLTSSYAPPEQQQQQVTNGPATQSGLKIRIKYGSADQQTSIVREIEQSQPAGGGDAAFSKQGAEEAANRRKRKISNDSSSRTTLSLVNGGSKPVSPCTPLPSPSPSVIENAVGSPATSHSMDAAVVNVAAISRLAKKSKSSSPVPVPSPAPSVTNVLQRPKLKSTAELVAEMTSSYPETMSISLQNVVPTPASPKFGVPGAPSGSTVMQSVLAAEQAASDGDDDAGDDDSKDEDYEEPGIGGDKRKGKVTWTASFVGSERAGAVSKAELIDRYLRDHSGRGIEGSKRAKGKGSEVGKSGQSVVEVRTVRPPIDWYTTVQLPPIDASVLDGLFEAEESGDQPAENAADGGKAAGDGDGEKEADGSGNVAVGVSVVKSDSASEVGKLLDSCIPEDGSAEASSSVPSPPVNGFEWRSRLLKETTRKDRQVLAMPYVDIGLPDFLEYGYSNRQQYLAHWSDR